MATIMHMARPESNSSQECPFIEKVYIMPPARRVIIKVAISDTSIDHMMDPTSYRSKKDAERTKATDAKMRIIDMGRDGPYRNSWISPMARHIITIDKSPEARNAFKI
jgi:hypothetical protein